MLSASEKDEASLKTHVCNLNNPKGFRSPQGDGRDENEEVVSGCEHLKEQGDASTPASANCKGNNVINCLPGTPRPLAISVSPPISQKSWS
jgi:hypothetical protein